MNKNIEDSISLLTENQEVRGDYGLITQELINKNIKIINDLGYEVLSGKYGATIIKLSDFSFVTSISTFHNFETESIMNAYSVIELFILGLKSGSLRV